MQRCLCSMIIGKEIVALLMRRGIIQMRDNRPHRKQPAKHILQRGQLHRKGARRAEFGEGMKQTQNHDALWQI